MEEKSSDEKKGDEPPATPSSGIWKLLHGKDGSSARPKHVPKPLDSDFIPFSLKPEDEAPGLWHLLRHLGFFFPASD